MRQTSVMTKVGYELKITVTIPASYVPLVTLSEILNILSQLKSLFSPYYDKKKPSSISYLKCYAFENINVKLWMEKGNREKTGSCITNNMYTHANRKN